MTAFICPKCKQEVKRKADRFEVRVEWRQLETKASGKRVQVGYSCRSCMNLSAMELRAIHEPDLIQAIRNVFEVFDGDVAIQEVLV